MFLDLTTIRQPETVITRDDPATAFPAEDGFQIIAPVRLEAVLHKDDDRCRLVGRLTTRLELACSRCLEPFAIAGRRADRSALPAAGAGR